MDPGSALAHLESVVCSTDRPTIEAWPAKPDGDTSKGLPPLVSVDSPLGFTVVAVLLSSSHLLDSPSWPWPQVRAMTIVCSPTWRANGQPYLSNPMVGVALIRLTDGILRGNQTLAWRSWQPRCSHRQRSLLTRLINYGRAL